MSLISLQNGHCSKLLLMRKASSLLYHYLITSSTMQHSFLNQLLLQLFQKITLNICSNVGLNSFIRCSLKTMNIREMFHKLDV